MIPFSRKAYQLLHRGSIALAKVESNGIRVDVPYLDGAIRNTKLKVAELKSELEKDEIYKVWKKKFGQRTNMNSVQQLGTILFKEMKFKAKGVTATGQFSVSQESLNSIDHPFIQKLGKYRKYQKLLSTYLIGVREEVQNGFLYPFFNLHTVTTYRSSSDRPNFQNIPIRDKEIGRLIRSAIIARRGNQLIELDYGGIEVKVAACYHKDPNMLSYLNDPSKDMHRDMAMDCFCLKKEEVTKDIRYCGKNMFVFPQFYGDWWLSCSRALWEAIERMKLKTVSGIPLKKHLMKKGIKELGKQDPSLNTRPGTFEHHIKNVEKDFWNRRFPVYALWKKKWYNKYLERGWLKTHTGFICQGPLERNKIINYPVQGSAFHCLLWSLNRLVLEELQKRNMRALIVGQIHDSIVADVPTEEIQDFLGLAEDVMIKQLKREWGWIVTPLEIEADVVPVGGSWYDKVPASKTT